MGLSFSATAKSEICRYFPQKRCCALAEAFGILLFCNSFTRDCIRIIKAEHSASNVSSEDDLMALRNRLKERKGIRG